VSCVDLWRLKHISVLISGTNFVRSRCCQSDKLALNSNRDFVSSREVEEETRREPAKTIQVVVAVWQIHAPLIEVWLPNVDKTLLFGDSLAQEVCSPRCAHTNTLFHYLLFALEILIKSQEHFVVLLRNSEEFTILVEV
jgi:hypothetical protein